MTKPTSLLLEDFAMKENNIQQQNS